MTVTGARPWFLAIRLSSAHGPWKCTTSGRWRSGAGAAPDAEDDLLDTAQRQPLHDLRRKVAEERAKADTDREERARRLHRQRCVRRWDDADGMGNLLVRLPGDQMNEIDARLKPRIDRAFADARDAGRMEPVEAYGADVVRNLLLGSNGADDGPGPGKGTGQAVRPEKKVIALIDVEALNRGRVEPGETCEIAGVGPVAVSAVRRLLSDALLTVVFRKGTDILHVTHLGRQVTATQRTALEARGARCERCGSRHLLDIDHNEGWTLTHDTRIEDLSWQCWHCHDLKTRHDLKFAGPIGNRWLVHRTTGQPWRGSTGTGPPDDQRARRRPPDAAQAPGGADPPANADEPSSSTQQGDLFGDGFTTAR